MTLTVNQSLNAPANVTALNNSAESRRQSAEQKIAAVPPQGTGIRHNAQLLSTLDAEQRKPSSRANRNDSHAERALAAYQSLQHQQRRTEIQSMLGVDIYA
jgi:hypothetical protein